MGIRGRVTFVIDKEEVVVRRVFSSQLRPTRHISWEALDALGSSGTGENDGREQEARPEAT